MNYTIPRQKSQLHVGFRWDPDYTTNITKCRLYISFEDKQFADCHM